MTRRIAQLGAAAALAATAFLPSTASAYQYIPPCSDPHLNIYALNLPGYTECMKDRAAGSVTRVGTCTAAYEPLSPPIVDQAPAQTLAYVDCL